MSEWWWARKPIALDPFLSCPIPMLNIHVTEPDGETGRAEVLRLRLRQRHRVLRHHLPPANAARLRRLRLNEHGRCVCPSKPLRCVPRLHRTILQPAVGGDEMWAKTSMTWQEAACSPRNILSGTTLPLFKSLQCRRKKTGPRNRGQRQHRSQFRNPRNGVGPPRQDGILHASLPRPGHGGEHC